MFNAAMPRLALLIPVLLAGSAMGQSFSGLGFLPGDSASWAVDLSEDGGTVIGEGSIGTAAPHHWAWTNGTGLFSLGQLPGYDGDSRPGGVSANGSVITGSISRTIDGSRAGYRWTPAGIGPFDSGSNSFSPEVSADGLVIFGSDAVDAAYRWTLNMGRQSLGALQGTPRGAAGHSYALASSEDGAVIVGSADALRSPPLAPIFTPFRWTASTGMQALLDNGQLVSATATDVSSDGSIIVGAAFAGDSLFRWTTTGGYQFIAAFSPVGGTMPARISGDGVTVIAGSTYWTAATGPRHLTDVLTAAGCNFSGWSITGATGISYDGTVLCGEGIDPQGNREAWIATVPSPGAAIPLLGVLAWRRRR
jgi:uncharacterized membrane protein